MDDRMTDESHVDISFAAQILFVNAKKKSMLFKFDAKETKNKKKKFQLIQ